MGDQAAAREDEAVPALTTQPTSVLAPQLLMVARRGDIERLKDLLQLDGGGEQGTEGAANTGAADMPRPGGQVVLQVDGLAAAAPAPLAGATSSSLPPVLEHGGVTIEGDSLLHVVAECCDNDDESTSFLDCAKMIVRAMEKKGGSAAMQLALEARNRNGDTPLHRAAGAGNANMIGCLIDLIASTADDDEATAALKAAFLRTRNERGETALHQVVRAARNKEACIDQLMAVDPELACIPHEDGASPLYLAISLGEIEIAEYLYVKSKGKLSYYGPDGRNVLHAAVYRGQALPMILKWLKDMKPEEDSSSSVSLISRLTSQRDKKQNGSTPLHLAASYNWWPGSRILSRWFPEVWPTGESMVTLLLDANESTAYQADDEGSYPIHVAAWSGILVVVKMLLERCPDCATLRDGKGRTFLHVAAEEECLEVVRYVISGEMPRRLLPMILNAQDSNGDTALHGAVRAGNLAVFSCLFCNRQVRLDVANKDGMTPLDLSCTKIPAGFYYSLNPRGIVARSLFHAGAPHGGGRPELFYEKHMPKRDVDKESEVLTQATQVFSIVTAIIATITFASAFTFPGGYRSADDAAGAEGAPVLSGTYAFDAFILANVLAFLGSIGSTCYLIIAGLPAMDISIRRRYFNYAQVLLQSAARSLMATFGLGLYLVVHNTASAIAACAIISASSLFGNLPALQIIRMVTMVYARVGIRSVWVRIQQCARFLEMMFLAISIQFWSYVIIFGLPAIRKRIH